MTQHLSPEEIAALERHLSRVDAIKIYQEERYRKPDDKYPGWLTLLIWLSLGALSWVPIVTVIYLMW